LAFTLTTFLVQAACILRSSSRSPKFLKKLSQCLIVCYYSAAENPSGKFDDAAGKDAQQKPAGRQRFPVRMRALIQSRRRVKALHFPISKAIDIGPRFTNLRVRKEEV
jgi:hypothetical protein